MKRLICIATALFCAHVADALAGSPDTLVVDTQMLPAQIELAKRNPAQFAVPVKFAISTSTHGVWTEEGDDAVWQLRIVAPGAVSLSFHAPKFVLPANASMVVAGAAGNVDYTMKRDAPFGDLWSRPTRGETMDVVIRTPTNDRKRAVLNIDEVQVGYREPMQKMAASSDERYQTPQQACRLNYSCESNESNRGPAQSAIGFFVMNTTWCSGNLVNNLAFDLRPLVLTALHCIPANAPPSTAAESVRVLWNRYAPCGEPFSYWTEGSYPETVGAVHRAKFGEYSQPVNGGLMIGGDQWLFELLTIPSADVVTPYFLGVDATVDAANQIGTNAYNVNYSGANERQYADLHVDGALDNINGPWWIVSAVRGLPNDGASGSALITTEQRTIGSLSTGGPNDDCSGNYRFSRVSGFWSGDGTPGGSARFWLDPNNTGTRVFDGAALPASLTLFGSRVHADGGDTVDLIWSTENAGACTASGDWSGTKAVNASERLNVGRGAGTRTYTLACRNLANQYVTRSVMIDVSDIPPPTVALGADQTRVTVGETVALSWTATGAEACAASGDWAGAKSAGGGTESVAVGTDAGTRTYTLSCSNPVGSTSKTVTVDVVAPPPGLTFAASASSAYVGETVTLSWTPTSAEACTASGDWTGAKSAAGGSESVNVGSATGAQSYTLSCSNTGGDVVRSVTVDVLPQPTPPAVALNASESTVHTGDSVTLSWAATDAEACVASGAWSGSKSLSGSESRPVGDQTGTRTYTLTCTNAVGDTVKSAVVEVVPAPTPPAVALSASASSVTAGESITLTWVTQDAEACSAAGDWSGNKNAAGGSETLGVGESSGQRTYTLTCTNAVGDTQRAVTIDVLPAPTPPVVSLTSSTSSANTGESVTLTWTATDADTCVASGDWSGSKSIEGGAETRSVGDQAGERLYTLTCSNEAGDSARSVVVDVIAPPRFPSVSFAANADTVEAGQTVTMSWTATNADSCLASGEWSGSKSATGGSETVGVGDSAGQRTYELACSNADGTTSRSVVVDVQPMPAPAVSLAASRSSVLTSESVTLTWTVARANTCTATGNWSGSKAVQGGTETVAVGDTAGMRTYGLNCTNAGGAGTASVSVQVETPPPPPAPTLSLSASATSVDVGSTVTLTWTARDASSCAAENDWSGSRGLSGSAEVVVGRAGENRYALRCSGAGGEITRSVTVLGTQSELLPTVNLAVTPATVTAGETVTLSWKSTDAVSCVAVEGEGFSGSLPVSGSRAITVAGSARTETYRIRCENGTGSATDSVTVTVQEATAKTASSGGGALGWQLLLLGLLPWVKRSRFARRASASR